MGIERKPNGFYESDADERLNQPHSVGIESSRVDACIDRYNEGGLKGLFGSPHFGFHGENLDFLNQTKVKPVWVWFWDIHLKSVEALYGLAELDHFGVNPKRPGIDFSRFRRMTSVVNHWVGKDTGLAKAAISKYY